MATSIEKTQVGPCLQGNGQNKIQEKKRCNGRRNYNKKTRRISNSNGTHERKQKIQERKAQEPSSSYQLSRYDRWINRKNEQTERYMTSTPNISTQNSELNISVQSSETPNLCVNQPGTSTFLKPKLPGITKCVNRFKRELKLARQKQNDCIDETKNKQRQIWNLQKKLQHLEKDKQMPIITISNDVSVFDSSIVEIEQQEQTPVLSYQKVKQMLIDDGINPNQHPKLLKALLLNEALVDRFSNNTKIIEGKKISDMKLSRYLAAKLSVDRRQWIAKK